ncbi:MAG: pseudouridine synthase [Candidatus Saccharimonadales bacterium]
MRINKFIAQATGLSRRKADDLISSGKVLVNKRAVKLGQDVSPKDDIVLDGKKLKLEEKYTIIMLNKPEGYVCSREGQGSKTTYDLLPEKYHRLKTVGRLDKDSSGLILLTDNGELANKLTHPKYQKEKVYKVRLNKTLELSDKNKLITGVELEDGLSKFIKVSDCSNHEYEVVLTEGRNRQIRRTFNELGYKVEYLHRTKLGNYELSDLPNGKYISV